MNPHEQIEQWFIQYGNDIHNYLVYYTENQDVEDLVQEVFIKAMKAIDGFQGRSNPKTWLFSIARNIAIDLSRKRKLIKWVPDQLLRYFSSGEKSPDEIVEMNEDRQILYQAIQKLKSNYRDVILLREIHSLSVQEVAEILDWSHSKVNVTLHRAIKALQRELMISREGGKRNGTLDG